MSRLSTGTRAFALAAALLCAGCLDFDKQTIILKISPDGQKADMLLVYEGLQVSGEKEDALKKAKEQLEQLAKSQERFYLLSNFPFIVDLVEYPNEPAEEKARKARVKKMLTIKNGGFFLDAKGRLGLWQTVSTTNGPGVLDEVNLFFAEWLANTAKEKLKARQDKGAAAEQDIDDRTLSLWQNALTTRPKVVSWKNGKIVFEVPCSAADATRFKKEADASPELSKRVLEANHTTLEATPDGVRAMVGSGGSGPIKIAVDEESQKKSDPAFNKQLLEFARTLPLAFKDGVTAEKLIAEFSGPSK